MAKGVHPQIAAVIAATQALGQPKLVECSVDQARALTVSNAQRLLAKFPAVNVHKVENIGTEAGTALRVYRPDAADHAPSLVFFHGGGHVMGDLETHDHICRSLCVRSGGVIIAVDYPLAPEAPFPAAPLAAFEATEWIASHAEQLGLDADRIVVGGDSAGGNLATVVAIMAEQAGGPYLAGQALIYPVVDYRGGTSTYDQFGVGYGVLEADTVRWFGDHYLPDVDMYDDWRASPHLAPSHSGLPQALMLLAECDVLHAEGVAYADQLRRAGVTVEQVEFPGMIHAFFNLLGPVDATAQAHQVVADWLRKVWA